MKRISWNFNSIKGIPPAHPVPIPTPASAPLADPLLFQLDDFVRIYRRTMTTASGAWDPVGNASDLDGVDAHLRHHRCALGAVG